MRRKTTLKIRKILGNIPLSLPFILTWFLFFVRKLRTLAARVLAPLRRITARELVIFKPDPRVNHFVYSLRDTLECEHEQEHVLFDGLRELLNAYHESALIRARRHRCHPCLAMAEIRKPVRAVPLFAEKAAGAA